MRGFKVLHGSRAEKLRWLTYRGNHVVGERIAARSSTVRLEFEASAAVVVAGACAVLFGDGIQSLCGVGDVAQVRKDLVALA